ncbi:DedA family protein [Blochmannia endosymbiont of Camponotus sp.]|uniref:DedA family protein n=1 Tax=Blochmannia endosymbiont of Camponotus sp. TaxID=700220 RepID=UPI0020255B03|nr:DedA family protein [Blochmannia endosymbiont of Camponotus sp.]URJ32250.1 DedA family protein [Blochmannia endosymbiont of Camponotus sp.]
MNILKELLNVVLWQNNIVFFPNARLALAIYSLAFLILFLENAIIPAVFLPGDSLLVILGVLVAKGVLNFTITLGILTIAVSLGSWISYLQGKFLENNKILKRWLSLLPNKFYQRANYMIHRHGLSALFIGRFIALVRTVLPIIAGISGLSSFRFQLFNWISSFLWVFVFIVLGFFLERLEFFHTYYSM